LRIDYFSFGSSVDSENAKRICGLAGIEEENISDDPVLGSVRMAIDDDINPV
jgi:hypothetical protein